MIGVRLAQVLAGATPFRAGNINETYRGVVLTEEGERTAIIKDLAPKELANEVLGAALGLAVGLPIPPPFLAFAHPDRFGARMGPALGEGRLVFASVDVAQPQVAVLYNGGGGKQVLDRLATWWGIGVLYGFDALAANTDRHAGNVLFSGDREVWAIDHGHCFTGPQWQPSDLEPPDREVANPLEQWLTPALSERQRSAGASVAANVEAEASRIDLPGLATVSHLEALLSAGDVEAVLSFVNARQVHVPRLAARALGAEGLI